MQRTITFENTDEDKKLVLAMNGLSVDEDDFIIDASSNERVLSPSAKEVSLGEFAGLRNGSVIVITDDLPSILEQSEYIED